RRALRDDARRPRAILTAEATDTQQLLTGSRATPPCAFACDYRGPRAVVPWSARERGDDPLPLRTGHPPHLRRAGRATGHDHPVRAARGARDKAVAEVAVPIGEGRIVAHLR